MTKVCIGRPPNMKSIIDEHGEVIIIRNLSDVQKELDTIVGEYKIVYGASIKTPTKTIFSNNSGGRLGNQLFQYAYGLHLAKKYNLNHIGNLHLLAGIEGIPSDVCNRVPVGRQLNLCHYNLFKDMEDDRNIEWIKDDSIDCLVLAGYHQSYSYFGNILDEVHNIFGDVKKKNSIGIHVRRTDYINFGVYMNLELEYYLTGVKTLISRNIPCEEIVIFSDDLEWCNQHLVDGLKVLSLPIRMFDADPIETMKEMKAMSGMVIPNSTFSFWGAVVGGLDVSGGIVVPDVWNIPGGQLPKGLGIPLPYTGDSSNML